MRNQASPRPPSARLRVPTLARFAAAVIAVAIVFDLSVSSTNAGGAPLSVVRADTQESVVGKLVQLNTGGPPAISVSQKEKTFTPAVLTVRVGQVVEIKNDDATVHNAYCSAGDFKFNSGPQQPGAASTLIFSAPGTYDVRCAIHPKMRLTVTVTP